LYVFIPVISFVSILLVIFTFFVYFFFFSSRRRHTRWPRDWSSDVCSSDLVLLRQTDPPLGGVRAAAEHVHPADGRRSVHAAGRERRRGVVPDRRAPGPGLRLHGGPASADALQSPLRPVGEGSVVAR